MLDLFEKIFLTGVGVMSLSQKKAEELLAELREKYRMSEEEGREFLEKAQALAREGKDKIAESAEAEVKKALNSLGLVSRDEFDRLSKRVERLEELLGNR
ncbi:MAG TPA: phasin family protein [Geobacteraceae bacterium]|nr:phasin family protein [Geobacteraceae bacterium]